MDREACIDDNTKEILDRKGFEFVDGHWLEKNVGAQADMIGFRLAEQLITYVDAQRLGLVFGPECGYQAFPDDPRRMRKPDVSFVRFGRLADDCPPRGNIRIAPDFAAEIISPSDNAEEINTKVQQYLRAGIKLVWVVYPKNRSVWVFRANGSSATG